MPALAKVLDANPVSALRLLSDKLALREFLASSGLSAVRYATAERPADVRAALARFGYPAVLKPTSLAGGRGVYLVSGPQHLNGWAAVLGRYGYAGPFLVEEYLRGAGFTVITMSRGGAHEVVGVARKDLSLPPLFVEMGHVYPAPLPAEQAQAIGEAAVAVLRACGYVWGPAHTDIVWTADGPQVVGTQAGLVGGRVPRLAELASGVDMERVIFGTGVGVPATSSGTTAAVSYFWLPCGEVESVAGLEQIRSLPYVVELAFPFEPGDRIPETTDAKSRHGHVIVTARSSEEAERRIAIVRRMLKVVLRPRSALGTVPRPRAATT
jgi:biotin carboxylase